MALIKCSECGKEISSNAEVCPSCGALTRYGKRFRKKQKVKSRSNIQGLGCLTIIFAVVLGVTVIGMPLAAPIGVIGFIILIAGLLPVW